MAFRVFLLVILAFLAACVQNPEANLGPNGLPYQRVYVIGEADSSKIQFNMLDGINSIRKARGLKGLILSSELNAAASTHSRDMS
ncbi:MAG: CAP domain-containing protein, partial [Planktomarina sp.]|nr:CAP domain-containing protein [Planktomarina sp.]MDT2057287.1 CAP domain-containing protein [Planktomarina sp.]